jgi:tricorn protease
MLQQPAVSDSHIAFVYADDLWLADLDGANVRRLTSHVGTEVRPRFSPDGGTLAFTGEYEGDTDVYAVPIAGGIPQRLTWHPSPDMVLGFTPDGQVLFNTLRNYYTNRRFQIYSVSLAGGQPEKSILPYGNDATYSPDGSHIAYTPQRDAFTQWKNYRGGTAARIWIFDTADHSIDEIPQPEGRCNDDDPMWPADKIYFRSDRAGEFNLFSYDPGSGAVEQLTFHEDFPVLSADATAEHIVYEQAGYLHRLDLASGETQRLRIGVAADLEEVRPRFADGAGAIRGGDISPSGARAVLEVRGEIVTVPAEKGDPRNLTQTPGTHERDPAWSPDGRWIAYFSDRSGEVQLHLEPSDGKGQTRVLDPQGKGFYDDLQWSPDSEKLSYTDNSWSTYWIDVKSAEVTKVSSEIHYGPLKALESSWSPDSRWLAYTRGTPSNLRQVFVYSLEEDRSYPITDGLSDVAYPVFDANGKYLHFFASTDAGPVRQWFAQSNADMALSGNLYTVVLKSGEPSPLAPQSDEEEIAEEKKDAKGEKENGKKNGKKNGDENGEEKKDGGEKKDAVEPVVIDFEGLDQRILALPVPTARYRNLQRGAAGQLYYLRTEWPQGYGGGGATSLRKFDLESREETSLMDNASAFLLSPDGKKILVASGGSYWIADAGGPIDASKGKLAVEKIQIQIDPPQEWAQIFDEAWRINRDYFYDPDMHGADWDAVKEKYAALIPHVPTREDLNRVLQWMGSELGVGHHYVGGGDFLHETEEIPGGLLGADYETHEGRYRFAKVYGGLNWNPDLRSPLTEAGVEVKEGEYLLAVDGTELKAGDNLHRLFENTAGKIVELKVGPNPDGSDSRVVRVQPLESERALRNRDWVEGNLRRVEEATDGRVAYVHVPDTTYGGHTYFKRYFYPQVHKQAVIVDERHNAGGQVADYVIDALRRPLISYWTTRYGQSFKAPFASIQGPKVMLIDETAGSGGDLLPWMFHKLEMGPLVGKRTWGGLVGILGFPVLMDGGFISAPNIAFWTPEDGYAVENEGVPPDIEVEQLPKDLIEGRDPQLEKAIEVVLEMLEENPPEQPEQPPFPVRVRQ